MSERDMRSLIALLEKRLGIAWADVIEWLRSTNTLDAIELRLTSGRLDDVINEVTTAAEMFATQTQNAYLTAGAREAAYLDAKIADSLVHFDSAYPSVVRRARDNAADKVYGLTTETRQNVRMIITEGVEAGTAPRETARRLRDSIGLHPEQERALANYRAALDRGQWSRALSYQLSSGNTDRTIQRLQRDGGQLTQEQKDKAVEAYRVNAIAHRAEMIARTETISVANQGPRDAIAQAVARGDLEADELEKQWHPGPKTKHARKDHRAMGRRKPIPVTEDYVLPDGTRMSGPGDPRGGAKHLAGCRCTESITFRSL